MSIVETGRLIFDVYRAGRKDEFLANRLQFVKGYSLSDEEREAVLAADYPALYAMGVHPMLCMYLARTNSLSVPEYLAVMMPLSTAVLES